MPMGIWKFLFGCVTIQIEGLYLEAFLNELHKKYRIHRIARLRHTCIRLTVAARHARKICTAAERRNLHCDIVGKDRQIRFAEMLLKRWWIPAALLLLLACMIGISQYCLSVKILGNEKISEFALCEMLEENGIYTGIKKKRIDLLSVKNLLYQKYPELAYAEARFDGTALVLILQEGNEIPEILSREPCTIVAEKRGVILSVTVGEGSVAVQQGEIVSEGTPLILGKYQKKEMDFLVHARGKVLAQVDYFGSAELSLSSGLVRTGKKQTACFLQIGSMQIPLSGKNPYALYEEETRTEIVLLENMPAFLKILETTYYECERGVSEESRRTAEIRLREQAYYAALCRVPEDAQILDFYSVITEQGGKLRATATVTVCEDIGREIPLLQNTEETGES